MKKTSKGFTLVELIVVMAVLSILLLMVGAMFRPINRLFEDTTKYTEDRYVLDELNTVLDNKLKFATNIAIFYDAEDYSSGTGAYWDVAADDFNTSGKASPNGPFLTAPGTYNYDSRLHMILIQNVATDWTLESHLKNNDGEYNTGRILMLERTPDGGGVITSWLVGGKAFYGKNNYFINLNTDPTTGMLTITNNTLSFTTLSLMDGAYQSEAPADQAITLNTLYRDKSAADCAATNTTLNVAQKDIVLVNSPYVYSEDEGDGSNIYIVYTLPNE